LRTSPLGDATRQLALPFEAFGQLGLTSRAVLLGLALFVGSLVAAWRLRHALPEIAIWLLADAILLVTAAVGVAEDTLNLTRLAPLAVPAIALAIAMRTAPAGHTPPSGAADTGPRTGSVPADLVP
jgi:hypothetical protein